MKKATLIAIATLMFTLISSTVFAQAGNTATGTLNVTATVNSSIQLVFNSDPAGVALSPLNGSATATLAFGPVSAFGTIPGTIARTVNGTTSFKVSTPVDVFVTESNSSSATYTLTAQLGTADATNTWSVGGTTINNTSTTNITSGGTYASNLSEAVGITIPFSFTGGSINNSIIFTATSN